MTGNGQGTRSLHQDVVRLRWWLEDHKMVVYTTLFFLVAVFSLLLATPAYANPGSNANPGEWAAYMRDVDNLQEATRLLGWNRWYMVNTLGTPGIEANAVSNAVIAGIHGATNLFFLVASFLVFLTGTIVTIGVNIDILRRSVEVIDFLFGQIGSALISGSGTATASLILMVIAGVAVIAVVRAVRNRSGVGGFSRSILFGFSAVLALAIMAASAMGNQSAPAANDDPSLDPGDYNAASPAWVISHGVQAGNWLSRFLSSSVNAFTRTIASIGDTGNISNECSMYIDAMHSFYPSELSQIPLMYDRLALAMYFSSWRTAALSEEGGSNASWCRIAEVIGGTPAAQQIAIADEAGLYPEASEYLTNGSGEWADSDSANDANSLFGPTFTHGNSYDKMAAYWAACSWSGGGSGVELNPDWAQVTSIPEEAGWLQDLGGAEAVAAIREWVTGNPNYLDAESCQSVMNGENDEYGFDGDGAASMWEYREIEAGVPGIFSFRVASNQPMFTGGPGPALNYYVTSQGLSSPFSAAMGLLALILMIAVFKYMMPIVIGGVIAQGIGIVAWMALPFTLMATAFGTPRVKSAFSLNLKSIFWSTLAVTLYAAVLMLLLGLFEMFRALIFNPSANSLLQILQVAFAAIVAFYITKQLLAKTINYDMTSFKGAVTSAGLISGRSVMSAAGYGTDKPIFAFQGDGKGKVQDFNPFRTASEKVKDAQSKLRSGKEKAEQLKDISNRLQGKGDPNKAEDPTKKGVASTVGGPATSTEEAKKGTFGRLTDQVRSYVGKDGMKNLPSGSGSGLGGLLEGMGSSETKELSGKMGGHPSTGMMIDDPNATRESLLRYSADGPLSLSGGSDPNADSLLRTYTFADMFSGVRPMLGKEIDGLDPSSKNSYLSSKIDGVRDENGTINGKRAYSLPSRFDGGVYDPRSKMYIPEGLVASGNGEIRNGQENEHGITLSGLVRGADGQWKPALETARTPSPFFLESPVAPEGVDEDTWASLQDMQSWIKTGSGRALGTSPSTWPENRQAQMDQLAGRIEEVYGHMGFQLPNLTDADLTRSASGMNRSDSTSGALDPSAMRNTIEEKGAALRSQYAALLASASNVNLDGKELSASDVASNIDEYSIGQLSEMTSGIDAPEISGLRAMSDQYSMELSRASSGLTLQDEMKGLLSGAEDERARSLQSVADARLSAYRDQVNSQVAFFRRQGAEEIERIQMQARQEESRIDSLEGQLRGRREHGVEGEDFSTQMQDVARQREDLQRQVARERQDAMQKMTQSISKTYDSLSREEVEVARTVSDQLESVASDEALRISSRIRERATVRGQHQDLLDRTKSWFAGSSV